MYLKSLEIHGFKSFANKITLEFHNGITGIVGPNGSGKSNVGDAVRWVLGEQSAKQLRGGNMQDVIFSGTENRKALGFAYVAITLDNTDHQLPIDYEEVTVSRRLYRSGESEYQINGTATRLKDINELFYDTGIGKEGYSIIGQGQIDKILSGKPEERRELFDEAAGIVKFKRRKNTAQKKLEAERQNLIRVNDILTEMEKQLAPLEKQAETAKVYLKKKEELKIFDSNLFLLEITAIREQLESIDEKKRIAAENLEETTREYHHTKEEYEQRQKSMESLDAQIEEIRELSNGSMLKCQELEGRINVLKEQMNTARLNEEHYQSRIQTIQQDIQEKEKQSTELGEEKQQLDDQLAQMKERSSVAGIELEAVHEKIRNCSEAMDQAKASIIEILNRRGSTKGDIQRYDTMLEQIQIRKSELNQKILKLKSDESALDETITEQQKELDDVMAVIGVLKEEGHEIETELNTIQQELIKKNKELEIGQTTFHREESRLESLKNITERYDGYGNSIRKVMARKDAGVLGVVADIVKVEKKYETAIETALGGSIQNIVTRDEDTAKRMIQYLKQNRFGRATFLPLTSVGGRKGGLNAQILNEKGVQGIASDLVKADQQYDGLILYLLGRVLVVDHIDHAIAIARKYKHSTRIVTLDGESLSPGGSMTGGAFKNSSNLLGRRREVEELETSVQLLKKDMEQMRSTIDKMRNRRTELREKLVTINDKLHDEYIVQNTARMNVEQSRVRKEENASGYKSLYDEGREIEQQIKEIEVQKMHIQKKLDESVSVEKDLEQQIAVLQEELNEANALEAKLQKASEEAHVELSGVLQKAEFMRQNRSRVQEEKKKLEEELREIQNNTSDIDGEIGLKEEEIQRLQKEIEESNAVQQEARAAIEAHQKERETLSAANKTFFEKQEELSGNRNRLDKECLRLDTQKEKLEVNRDNYINYMWEEYELTASEAKELQKEEFDNISSLKSQIKTSKEEIRRLGDVNVNAIEDFKSLEERYTFLAEQHDDLVKAEQTLVQIIEELDEGMRRQFTEKFSAIQTEFDKVFKQLFGGGKGTLELMEDEDILEAGIQIISQPPGKKLQNMMQLSGGEKALTAIALLFAIQNLKPSPFCLLDEIEAALDDSNVSRYAKYLHKLTKNTQFIIITHRKGTMSAADRLYGITMQEKGVSTLVSVNLIENDLDK